ncbi:uncharacterized protein N7496_012595 [Penicillium cataractarum]|uniref:NAD(P)-binding domain-containing protein n=1 Tax=Penicillium cataractarum TaxID=2100454 RepID=A0A9W9R8C3_9EURO|nr:uncharacterized protein N7496_012595 [Penicillium cataractarum]KAJ5355383.1 hypothetical protein N7496_012595 [Penicillium cataractarum]
MRVLVLGAIGNLGSRLLTTLAQRGHTVVAFARTPSKLTPNANQQSLLIEKGDATKAADIKDAATRHNCDAIINAAGHAAMAPWRTSDFPAIVNAVIQAALELGRERGTSMRVWFLGGVGILDVPTRKKMIVEYMPMFKEHASTWAKLRALPPSAIAWSILCPGMMVPLTKNKDSTLPESSTENISAEKTVAPEWSAKFLRIPFIGPYLNIMSQISAYTTSYEDNADFIARDLCMGIDSEWVLQKVGVKRR